MEQRSQIVWKLRKGSTITPNVLKWLADTIRDYLCQLSPLSIITIVNYHHWHLIGRPNRTIVRRVSHLHQLYSISSNKATKAVQSPTSEYGYAPIQWHTKRVFRDTMEMILFCSRDSQDPRGYRMDRLGTLRRPVDSACI